MLRAGAHQQGRVDQGGGPAPHRLHQGPRRGLLEIAPKSRRCVRTMRIIKISLSFFLLLLLQHRLREWKLGGGGVLTAADGMCCAGLLRCGKSCRLRWINYLRPDLKRGNFTEEEDELIIKFHELFGNK